MKKTILQSKVCERVDEEMIDDAVAWFTVLLIMICGFAIAVVIMLACAWMILGLSAIDKRATEGADEKMSLSDLESILESLSEINNTVTYLIRQEKSPESISIRGQMDIIHDKVRQSIESHFNKDQQGYKVCEIVMTSTASFMLTSFAFHTRFVVKVAKADIDRLISCVVSMPDSGDLQIDNIYYADNGQPVEGLTKK